MFFPDFYSWSEWTRKALDQNPLDRKYFLYDWSKWQSNDKKTWNEMSMYWHIVLCLIYVFFALFILTCKCMCCTNVFDIIFGSKSFNSNSKSVAWKRNRTNNSLFRFFSAVLHGLHWDGERRKRRIDLATRMKRRKRDMERMQSYCHC